MGILREVLDPVAHRIELNDDHTTSIFTKKSARRDVNTKYIKTTMRGTVDVHETIAAQNFLVWQWKHRTGWRNYSSESCRQIEQVWQRGESFVEFVVARSNETYTIDF